MDLTKHPIHSETIMINTCAAQRFVWAIQRWLDRGTMGGYAFGLPRIGKTSMTRHALDQLVTRSGERVPAFLIPQQSGTHLSDRKFWSFMLSAVEVEYRESHRSRKLFSTLCAFLRERALSNGERRVVLFIDEAQKMTYASYDFLLDLVNWLAEKQVRPMIVSVGSNTLPHKVEQYHGPNQAHFRSRFFAAKHMVNGLRGPAEVAHALSWYDSPHPQSEHFKTACTADFMPESYAAGFRLADHAKLFWMKFRAEASGQQAPSGWTMESFQATVKIVLVDLLHDGAPLTGEHVAIAIRNSGLLGPIEDDDTQPAGGYADA